MNRLLPIALILLGPAAALADDAPELIRLAAVTPQPATLDLPDLDLGRTDMPDGETAAPHVQRAIKRVTKKVRRCFRKEHVSGANTQGSVISRFMIGPNGRAAEIKLVHSTFSARMGRCVKRAIRKTKFKAHGGTESVEVLAPWSFAYVEG